MVRFRLTKRADADLAGIFERSYRDFGALQADRYRDGLKKCCSLIASQPEMGRAVPLAGGGLRRHEHGTHVIFYREQADGVLITTILHKRRLLQIVV